MPKKQQFRTPEKPCPYCNEHAANSDDHLPPKSMLLRAESGQRQDQFITIRCCDVCNRGFSSLDVKFARFISHWLGCESEEGRRLWDEAVFKTYQKDETARRRAVDQMRDVLLIGDDGRVTEGTVMLMESAPVQQMMHRLVRGFYLREFGTTLPQAIRIVSTLMRDFESFEAILDKLPGNGIGEQFKYRYYREDSAPYDSMWFFSFHGVVHAIAATDRCIERFPDLFADA